MALAPTSRSRPGTRAMSSAACCCGAISPSTPRPRSSSPLPSRRRCEPVRLPAAAPGLACSRRRLRAAVLTRHQNKRCGPVSGTVCGQFPEVPIGHA